MSSAAGEPLLTTRSNTEIDFRLRNLRKVNLLLQALEDAGKRIEYYALDLSQKELERTLAQLPSYKHVRAHGLLGTYDDGREWLKKPSNASRQKCILSLGSSIGEHPRPPWRSARPNAAISRKFQPRRGRRLPQKLRRCAQPGRFHVDWPGRLRRSSQSLVCVTPIVPPHAARSLTTEPTVMLIMVCVTCHFAYLC